VHPDRIQLAWASAAQGVIFTEKVTAMTDRIAELGPLQWQDNLDDYAPALHTPEYEEVAHG
jgi:hypothetical protein